MSTNLRWKAPFAVTGLHLADGINRGLPLVDSRLAEALAGPVARLRAVIEASGAPSGRMWRLLAGLAGTNDSPRQIAEIALIRLIGRVDRLETAVGILGGAIAEVQATVRNALPKLGEELALRERPLREQWEARGPGLLFQIANLTEPQLVPPEADVLLVHPGFGGAGTAHLAQNSVRIEAVLANPHAELPEIARLAWLLAQLQLDLPALSENIHADRLPHVARLAMLPATLAAAESVDLVRGSRELTEQALRAWQLALPPGLDGVTLLADWWQTYQLDHPPFHVALEALDEMVG